MYVFCRSIFSAVFMDIQNHWWLRQLRICLQCRRPGFDPWVGKIPWRRERLPTPVFWPREFHGLYSPWGRKELDMTEQLLLHFSILVEGSSWGNDWPVIWYIIIAMCALNNFYILGEPSLSFQSKNSCGKQKIQWMVFVPQTWCLLPRQIS